MINFELLTTTYTTNDIINDILGNHDYINETELVVNIISPNTFKMRYIENNDPPQEQEILHSVCFILE